MLVNLHCYIIMVVLLWEFPKCRIFVGKVIICCPAPNLWKFAICGQEELWVFLSSFMTLFFFLSISSYLWSQEVTNLPFCPFILWPFPSPIISASFSQIASHFSESPSIHPLPSDFPIPIILSPLLLLAWD